MHRPLGCAHATTTFHLARLRRRLAAEGGQGTVEYIGLILLVVGIMAAVVAVQADGTGIAESVVKKLKGSIDEVGKAAPGSGT
jgi:hypothetical protein